MTSTVQPTTCEPIVAWVWVRRTPLSMPLARLLERKSRQWAIQLFTEVEHLSRSLSRSAEDNALPGVVVIEADSGTPETDLVLISLLKSITPFPATILVTPSSHLAEARTYIPYGVDEVLERETLTEAILDHAVYCAQIRRRSGQTAPPPHNTVTGLLGSKDADLALQAVNGVVWEWDFKTNQVYRSAGLYSLVGVHPEEADPTREWWAQRIHPEDFARLLQQIDQEQTSFLQYSNDYRIRHEDGRWVDVWERGLIEKDAEGNVVRVAGFTTDVSERRQAERLLKESEEFNRRVTAIAPCILYIYDLAERRNVWGNQGMVAILGYSRDQIEQMAGRLLETLMHPDDFNAYARHFARLLSLRDGETAEFEYRMRHADGSWRWLHSRDMVLDRDDEGQPVRIIGAGLDVTDRHIAEDRRALSERVLRAVFDHQFQFSALLSADGRIVDVSESALRNTKASRDQVIGKPFLDMSWWEGLADVRALWRKQIDEALTQNGPSRAEAPYRALDGSVRYAINTVTALRDTHQQVEFLLVEGIDISDRKRAEDTLRESEENYRAMFEIASVGKVQIEPFSGRFLRVNPAFCSIAGRPEAALLGSTTRTLTHPDDVEEDWALFDQLCRGELRFYGTEKRYVRPDQTIAWVRVDANMIRNSRGEPVYVSAVVQDITQRRLAEEALNEQRRILKTVTDNASVSLFIMDDRQHCVFMNPAAEALTGFTIAEVQDKPLHFYIHHTRPDGTPYPIDECPIDRALPERAQVKGEEVFVHKNGHFYAVEFTASPILDPSNRPIGTVIEVQDITERRKAEEALRASEERYRATFSHAAVGIAHIGLDGAWLRFNDAVCQITGYSADELYGMTFDDITHPDDIEQDWRHAKKLIAGEVSTYSIEKRYVRKDGIVVWVLLTVSLMRDPAGNPVHFISAIEDITERKRAEERLAMIVSGTRVGIFDLSLDDRTIQATDEFARLLGDEADGMPNSTSFSRQYSFQEWLSRIHPEDRPVFESRVNWSRAEYAPLEVEYRILTPHGTTRWVVTRGVVQGEADASARLLGICWDITDRKTFEEALKEADRQKDEFLATLAHELRNPIAPIRNGLQLMRLAGNDQQAVDRVRNIMERQVKHMVRLIDDLLDVSRISRGKINLVCSRVDLADVINQAVETSRPLIDERSHSLTVRLPENPIALDADATRLAQVLANLLNNAAKYTEPGGNITIAAELENEIVAIRVRDTGIGIRPDMLPRVFDLFSQVDHSLERTQGGLGIGLSLARGLVEMHGGTLEAKSDGPGHGSEFTVRLPVPATSTNAPETSPEAEMKETSARRRILVVDDNVDSAISLSMMLSAMGNETSVAHDGLEAIEKARSFLPAIIMLDIGMPKLNGYDTCRQIRQQSWGQEMIIVALTGWGQDEDREKSSDAGFDFHLVKPIDLGALQQILHSSGQVRSAQV